MKNITIIVLTVIITVFGFSCQEEKSNNNFKINATVVGLGDNTAYLEQRKDGAWVKVDSINMVADKGVFEGNIDLPEFFYITVNGVRGYIPVFVEQGEITVKTNVNNLRDIVVEGSATHTEHDNFMKSLATFDQKATQLGQQYQQARTEGDEDAMQQIEDEYMGIEEQKSQSMLDYAINNNESVASAFIIMSNSYMFELDQLDEVASSYSDNISESKYVKNIKDRVATLKRSAVGQKYIDFTLDDPEGNPIALSSDVDGKYVLVDFWASWCSPCRAENPNVVEAYNKYHDKGFDVFGVSFDKDHAKWVEAIEKDGLTWTHVSDLKYWASAAGKLYGIQSIPQNILLNPEGIIIEKNLRGQALQDKLAEIFAE